METKWHEGKMKNNTMDNHVALLIRNAPPDMKFSAFMKINEVPVKISACAFYDIFANNERLEDFVRALADGHIYDPVQAAQKIMDELGFN